MANTVKNEKKRSFTVEEKLKAVAICKAESLRAAARQFNVDRNCIRAWRDKEMALLEMHPTAKRLSGAGRRTSFAAIEEDITNDHAERKNTWSCFTLLFNK